jgi:hypothetical protein
MMYKYHKQQNIKLLRAGEKMLFILRKCFYSYAILQALLTAGQSWVRGRLKASHVFDWLAFVFHVRGAQILVQDGEYLAVEHLESADPVHHFLEVLSK